MLPLSRIRDFLRKSTLTKPHVPTRTGKVYNQWDHRDWDNSINIWDWKTCKLEGRLPFQLQIGDEIRFKMASDRIGCGLISEVRYEDDPPDMFWATFWPLGYLDDLESGA